MKTLLLILGVALIIIGLQDAARLLADSDAISIFGWIPGGYIVHIAAGIIVVVAGALLASYAPKTKSK